ncbi:ABC transporter substrate-binding protein [Streptomyces neyagawaensis]|uniref:ABC transporter substrate-binding protein n=1 Tax=Streptomyces neyagawaensis TaxID=42238 RepID=UPI0006E1B924|nr:ABC transporter substrate-binding protein [Streptomyces neyagawaensis]MCL6733455.1 ABC transporter substrate-binding protein [Streptomyces neyagawaensis]MDE1685268.1 ABC transporter substrate-binding protein [Streptomyces neyagawaensis]
MRHTRTRAVPVTAAVAMTAVLAGCTTTGATSGGPGGDAADATKIRTTIDVPASFDPVKALSLPDYQLARNSYDTLVRKDDGGLVGGLATDWKATPTSATFTLRTDATCADGTPITPKIVKASLDRFADPRTAAPDLPTVFGPGNKVKVTANDAANKVEIALARPWGDMVTGLSVASTGIVCPAGLKDVKALAAGKAEGSQSGPYLLRKSQSGVSYSYTLRPEYKAWPAWRTKIPGKVATTMEYLVSPDPTATGNLVTSGQLDIGKIDASGIPRFDGVNGHSVSISRFSDFYLLFNERPGTVFEDVATRRAVAQAVDRAAFTKVVSKDTGEPSTMFVQKNIPCNDPDSSSLVPKDKAAAADVLKGKKIRLVGPQVVGPAGAGNQYVQEALRAAGADVTLANVDVGAWVGTVFGKPDAWDLTVFADLNFLGTLANPLGHFVGPTVPEGGGNLGAVKNPALNKAFAQAAEATNEGARCAAYRKAAKALISNVDAVPLVNDPFIYALREGFSAQMLGGSLDDPILRITG